VNAAREALLAASWPPERAEAALRALARAAGLARPGGAAPLERDSDEGAHALSERLGAAAEAEGLEVEAVSAPYGEAEELVRRAAPALLAVQGPGSATRLLALLRSGARPRVLAPDGRVLRTTVEELASAWSGALEGEIDGRVAALLDSANLQGAVRSRARHALLAEHLAAVPVGGAWIVRLAPGRPFLELARTNGLLRLAAGIAAAGTAASVLALASWIPFGRGVLSGRFEPAWVVAWALLLASTLPLRWLEGWWQSLFGLRFGIALRRRLMAGATRLDPEAMRGEGAGKLLGRVLDAEALEGLLLAGSFMLVGAGIDVVLAGAVLTRAPYSGLALALFALGLGAALALGLVHWARARRQADARLALTHDLVERMVGQRTRLVQEARERWHLEEDALLATYLERSRALDGATLGLLGWIGGGWLVAGTVVLASAFAAGAASGVELALGVGAVLLGQQALQRLSGGLLQLSSCLVAWRQVRPLYRAAARGEEPGLPRAALRPGGDRLGRLGRLGDGADREGPLLRGRALAYRHAGRERDVLSDVDLELRRGERVLLEGPSGGGKSTLVALLTGLRAPRSGALLLGGLDRASQGARRWRRRIAAAPQFHENHVFTGTLAFNLTLAAPPEPDAAHGLVGLGTGAPLAEARAREVCEELGLGPLLERMPAGLRQIVGETGWQLSHGEKSRLFVARALLADAELVVLDESLAALDAETAGQVLDCVRRRAPALLLVAHP